MPLMCELVGITNWCLNGTISQLLTKHPYDKESNLTTWVTKETNKREQEDFSMEFAINFWNSAKILSICNNQTLLSLFTNIFLAFPQS